MNANLDGKLLKNVLDEINRLNAQLTDLEVYKDELPEDEIVSIKKETLDQLINNTKILEKMKHGEITTNNAIEQAKMKINSVLCDNYSTKDLINTYLAGESNFLRVKLNGIINKFNIHKVTTEEYETSVSEILEALAKTTSLNEEEKKLNDSLKNKVMNKYQVDKGINQNKIEKTFLK